MKRIYQIIYTFLFLSVLTACEDEINYYGDVPEGMSRVKATVSFDSFTPALDGSRSAGDAIKEIKSLTVVVYDLNGTKVQRLDLAEGDFKLVENTRPDGSSSSEEKTGHAEFEITLPNGKYRMYAVANCSLTDDEVKDETALKTKSLTWNSDGAEHNAEMFGYFTNFEKGPASSIKGFDADPVVVDGTQPLHAWIRRAASKLTIAFDTSNLNENVYIYLKSIEIKDIPSNCYLGQDNKPGEGDALEDGEILYFNQAQANDNPKTDHERWRKIANGDSVWGYYSDKNGPAPRGMSMEERIAREHTEAVEALYFYENLQGKGVHNTESDKHQDVTDKNENISYPEGVNPEEKAWKDAKPYGTYIEVKGYYMCENDPIRPGKGEIIYRFMLGKDTHLDYNAERNYHYRLTMVFNGYANDVDWHIDYREEDKPGLSVPDRTYVSYLYNQEASLVARATPKPGYELTSLKAIIIDNEWRPHKEVEGIDNTLIYNEKAWEGQLKGWGNYENGKKTAQDCYGIDDASECQPNCEFGFLSLRDTRGNVNIEMGGTDSKTRGQIVTNFRQAYYYPQNFVDKSDNKLTDKNTGPKGRRIYDAIPKDPTGENGIDVPDVNNGGYHISYTKKERFDNGAMVEDRNYVITIPLYTRAKSLDSWAVYSGANPFYQHHRFAKVKFVATYKKYDANIAGEETYTDVAYSEVLQARRINNPRGIYRRGSNKASFHVNLKYSLLTDASGVVSGYQSVISNGPWSAVIENDPKGLVKLTANGQMAIGTGSKITGRTNTEIDFTYTPLKAVSDNAEPLGAIITVYYHNNSCVHKIIVRQGYGPVKFDGGSGLFWSSYNVYDGTRLTASPLSIGSLFRRNPSIDYPILEINDRRTGFGLGEVPTENYKIGKNRAGSINEDMPWSEIPYNKSLTSSDVGNDNAFGTFTMEPTNVEYRVATYDEAKKDFIDNKDVNFAFGIVYADGASETLETTLATGFLDRDNDGGINLIAKSEVTKINECGVRGVVAYSLSNGTNLFFPMGSTGHGRRRTKKETIKWDPSNANGRLRYCSVDHRLGGKDGANAAGAGQMATNDYRPMAYNLPDQNGAAYWFSNGDRVALDLNYGNYNTGTLELDQVYWWEKIKINDGENVITVAHSDALPIKPVRVNPL